MPTADFEVVGADDFLRLSKALKAAGRTTLRRELNAAMKNAAKPLIKQTQSALAPTLPARLQSKGRNTKQAVKVSTGLDAGVRITATYKARAGRGLHGANARLLNAKGLLRHPLFGDRDRWFTTAVPGAKGWFDRTLTASAPDVRPHLERALRDVEDRIVREAGL